jgi:hypothetical protein
MTLQTVQLIIGAPGSQVAQAFYADYDGTAYTLCSSPAPRTQVPLDENEILNSGTAVTAISAGHRTAGGILQTGNAAGMYVNEITTAGTVVANGTVFVPENTIYQVTPGTGPVSVNATASAVIISGFGLQ